MTLAGEDVTKKPPYARVRRGLARTYQRGRAVRADGRRDDGGRAQGLQAYPSRHQLEWAATLVHLRAPMHQPATSLETLERRKLA